MGKINVKKKVLTLVDIINKNKQKNSKKVGSCYLEGYGGEIQFKRCDEELFFDLSDKYPEVFDSKNNDAKLSKYNTAMNSLLYECILINTEQGLLSLKDTRVRDALGVDPTKPDKIINNTLKALLPDFQDRGTIFDEIMKLSGFNGKSKKDIVNETKN